MSAEGDVVVVSTQQTNINSEMTIEDALRDVLKASVARGVIARGLHECVKTLDRSQAVLCVLSESCDEPNYVKVVEALCAENGIALMKVPDSKKLGEWVGFGKIDKNGDIRKVVNCSCAVIREFPDESAATRMIVESIKSASQ